ASAVEQKHEPLVNTVAVHKTAASGELVLPGALSAVVETPIYARSEGYITRRLADIGDRVTKGQLLVEIDTPELDEQLRQARYRYNQFQASSGATVAALKQAEANLNLAETMLRRTRKLVQEGVLSQQELDDK